MNGIRSKMGDKKIKLAEIKLNRILNKADGLKLSNYFVSQLDACDRKNNLNLIKGCSKRNISLVSILTLVVITLCWIYHRSMITGCLLQLPSDLQSLFRAPEDCSMCLGVDDVIRLANITAEEFEVHYAYSTNPVIVTDATSNWKAIKQFNFKFFFDFYRNTKFGRKINDCFFFSYKSGLKSLDDVLVMDEERANLLGEPWYVGWSTCHEGETQALRKYYTRPYFLPRNAESDMVDWIFMGGPGQGAHMHVDSVRHMSWQAQVRGRKQWQLAPPPECLYRCSWITFTVEPGEILVVDTNRWYHKTNVLPGDMSITIGAEYD